MEMEREPLGSKSPNVTTKEIGSEQQGKTSDIVRRSYESKKTGTLPNRKNAKAKKELLREKERAKKALVKEEETGRKLQEKLDLAQLESDRLRGKLEMEERTEVDQMHEGVGDFTKSEDVPLEGDPTEGSLQDGNLLTELKKQQRINANLKKDKDSLYKKLKEALAALGKKNKEHEASTKALEEEIDTLKSRVEDAVKEKTELLRKLKQKEIEIDDLRAHLVQLQAANEVHKDTIEHLQGDLEQKEVLLKEVTCLSEERLQTIHLLEETLKSHSQEIEHWRNQLEEQKTKQKDTKRILHFIGLVLIPLKAGLILFHAMKQKRAA